MLHNKIQELSDRLNQLAHQQQAHQAELFALRKELKALSQQEGGAAQPPSPIRTKSIPLPQNPTLPLQKKAEKKPFKLELPSNLEAFIGGNLIAKIGIVILILGLGYLVKYAVDHALMGPAMRVSMGFLSGIVLIGVAYWLKDKYRNYSGILLSGGLAILYFSAYSAYDFMH